MSILNFFKQWQSLLEKIKVKNEGETGSEEYTWLIRRGNSKIKVHPGENKAGMMWKAMTARHTKL